MLTTPQTSYRSGLLPVRTFHWLPLAVRKSSLATRAIWQPLKLVFLAKILWHGPASAVAQSTSNTNLLCKILSQIARVAKSLLRTPSI
jgi:hypothetical protein